MLTVTTFVGLDVHARSIKAVALDALTGEVRSATFGYDAAAVADWVKSIDPKARCTCGSGVTGLDLQKRLAALGVDCVIGAVSKMIKPAANRKRKNDRNDVPACYIDRVNRATEDKARLEKPAAEEASKPRWKRRVDSVQCLKGIDVMTAADPVLEAGEFSRFKSARSFAAWIGLTLSKRSSGEGVRRGGITKAGNRRLRIDLVESTWHCLSCSPHSKDLARGQVPNPRAGRRADKGVRRLAARRGACRPGGSTRTRRTSPRRASRHAGSGPSAAWPNRPDAATRPDGRPNHSHHPSRRFDPRPLGRIPVSCERSDAQPAPRDCQATRQPQP